MQKSIETCRRLLIVLRALQVMACMVIIVDTSNGVSTLKCPNRWYDTAWQQQPPLESHTFTESGMLAFGAVFIAFGSACLVSSCTVMFFTIRPHACHTQPRACIRSSLHLDCFWTTVWLAMLVVRIFSNPAYTLSTSMLMKAVNLAAVAVLMLTYLAATGISGWTYDTLQDSSSQQHSAMHLDLEAARLQCVASSHRTCPAAGHAVGSGCTNAQMPSGGHWQWPPPYSYMPAWQWHWHHPWCDQGHSCEGAHVVVQQQVHVPRPPPGVLPPKPLQQGKPGGC
jgi:hypothetical protein